MALVRYEPRSAGIVALLQSTEMQTHMAQVGADTAGIAAASAPRAAMETDVVRAFGRWVANIANTAPDALRQEYGGRNIPPQAPLGRALNQVRSADPHRRRR